MSDLSAKLTMPRWVRQLGELPLEVTQAAMTDSRDALRNFMQKGASKGGSRGLNVRTGRLLRSIRTYKRDTVRGAELTVGMANYGWFNNYGAVIVPKRAARLKFNIPGVGWRSAARVVLPARPFATDALDETVKVFPRYLTQAIDRYTAGPAEEVT